MWIFWILGFVSDFSSFLGVCEDFVLSEQPLGQNHVNWPEKMAGMNATTFWFFGNDRRAAIHPSFGFLFTKWNSPKAKWFWFLVFWLGHGIIQAGGSEQRINDKRNRKIGKWQRQHERHEADGYDTRNSVSRREMIKRRVIMSNTKPNEPKTKEMCDAFGRYDYSRRRFV